MSRRKQLKPRHLENEKGSGMDIESAVPIPTSPSPFMTNENGDAHVCGKCSAEFLDINDFLQHKEACTKKRPVLFFDDEDCTSINGMRPPKRQALEEEMAFPERVCSDGEEKQSLPDDMLSAVDTVKEDVLIDEEVDEEEDDIDDELIDDNDDFDLSSVNDDDEKANIEIEEEEKEKNRIDPTLKFNPEILARIQAMPFAFPHLFDNSNVVLEPMSGTKAAVAQFAENNVPPQDMAVLQSTLYNLQQQQIVQMHLIHQLQQQLIMGMGHGGNTSLPAHFNPQGLVTPPPLPENKLSAESGDDDTKHKHSEQMIKNGATSDSSNPDDYLPPSSVSRSDQPLYEAEDPFFKHKCRVCGKVFGSDSGLQIHLRSHTGEKPFKCNICGNRFSTKGNLKVHFVRHKEAYPHAEMNPHPVPEYLDSMAPQFSLTKSLDLPRGNDAKLLTTQATSSPVMATGTLDSIEREKRHIKSELVSSHTDSIDSESSQDGLKSVIKSEGDKLCDFDNSKREISKEVGEIKAEKPLPHSMPGPVLPAAPLPGIPTSFPFISPLSSSSPFGSFIPPFSSAPPTSENSELLRGSILPTKTIEPGENMDMYMEETRSETSKLKELVDNIERKITDPNQCVICHRVLSCKSALQMHYRIHTGERPFKCKICSRAFTTKGNLKTHLGVHRAKPPLRMMHQCPVCSKQFTNLLVLQQHIRMHSVDSFGSVPTNGMFPNYNWMHKPRVFPKEEQIKELDLSKPSVSESKDDDINNNINDKYSDRMEEKHLLDSESVDQGHASDNSNHSDDEMFDSKEEENRTNTETATEGMDSTQSNDSSLSDEQISDRTQEKRQDPFVLHSTPMNGHQPIYSTSLAALEERVRAIDNSMSQRYNLYGACTGLNLSRRPHQSPNHHQVSSHNGQRSLSISPKSGSVSAPFSEVNGHDATKLSPSSLSFSGESNSLTPGMSMLNPLDLRPGNHESKLSTTCNICYKTFACRSALDIHYRSHTKERPFQCDTCDRSFSTKGNMKQHMLTHKIPGHPDYNSEDDSSESTNPSTYTQPSYTQPETSLPDNTPNKERDSPESNFSAHDQFSRRQGSKHQCNTCHKTFSSASALQIHIRTHTGDKPFKCNVCGKAFTTKGNLKVHMGTHMWNNSPSRRGRRMSIEPPFLMGQKENPFMPGFGHRPSEFFYQYPPFLNGLSPKLNEISVIQSLNGAMGHMLPPTSMSFPPSQSARNEGHIRTDSPSPNRAYEDFILRGKEKESPSKHSGSQGEELDLSVKSSSSDSMRQATSPSTDDNTDSKSSPENWPWKVSCHICSQSFPSHAALDYHIQSNHLKTESQQKPIIAQ